MRIHAFGGHCIAQSYEHAEIQRKPGDRNTNEGRGVVRTKFICNFRHRIAVKRKPCIS